jgi:SAM-dependent methyltransferase
MGDKGETPSTSQQQAGQGMYGTYWDRYVDRWDDRHRDEEQLTWPGDEWGVPEEWAYVFKQLFEPAGVREWERAVEIGPGSGKYTLKVLEGSPATVRAYDVSERFLTICETRCREPIAEGRLSLHVLDISRPDCFLTDLRNSKWERNVDAVYSVAAMVHVDLQYLIVYLITAALVLRPGGKLVLTLATPTNELGFKKLVGDISPFWHTQTEPIASGKFEWVSPEIVRSVLPLLGFTIDMLSDSVHRELFVVASLSELERAEELEHFLALRGKARELAAGSGSG